jgi:hypothetical protein
MLAQLVTKLKRAESSQAELTTSRTSSRVFCPALVVDALMCRVLVVDALCRCFGSDRTPGVAPQGVFRSRTVSTTVAKWFMPIARETVDKIYRFGPLRDA